MFLFLFAIFHDCNVGKGAVYSFDPVGSYQRDTYKAGGSASAMLQPLLDNQVSNTHCTLTCCRHNPTMFYVIRYADNAKLQPSFCTMDKVRSCLVSPSTDWFQEHGGCAARSSDSGQGGSAGQRRLHLGRREGCLHRRRPSGVRHHQGGHR